MDPDLPKRILADSPDDRHETTDHMVVRSTEACERWTIPAFAALVLDLTGRGFVYCEATMAGASTRNAYAG